MTKRKTGKRNIRDLIKKMLFPVVFFVRAFRTYRMGNYLNNWHDSVLDGELLIKMKMPRGNFYIDARSDLIKRAFSGEYEEKTMKTLSDLKLKDGLIVNIGANIGFYAIELANIFPRKEIIALEPNPEAFELLVKNVSLNGYSRVIKTMNVCVSNKKGKIPFAIIPGKSEYSSIGQIAFEAVKDEKQTVITVLTKTLADIVKDKKVALIVMDVEGAEKLVLDGSMDLILRDKPIIISECADLLLPKFKSTSTDLVDTLISSNYKVYNTDNLKRKIRYPFNGNIIAIPQ